VARSEYHSWQRLAAFEMTDSEVMLVAALELPASHGICHIGVGPQIKLLIEIGSSGKPLLLEPIFPIMVLCRFEVPVLNGNIRILR
jgi:hypothetical protein